MTEIRLTAEGSVKTLPEKLGSDGIKFVYRKRNFAAAWKIDWRGASMESGSPFRRLLRNLWGISYGLNHSSAERMEKVDGFNKYFKRRVDRAFILIGE